MGWLEAQVSRCIQQLGTLTKQSEYSTSSASTLGRPSRVGQLWLTPSNADVGLVQWGEQ